MLAQDPIVIVSAARTPIGAFQGVFSTLSSAVLGGAAIKACVARAGLSPDDIEEVAMGCVLQAGQGQAPARQATLAAGLPEQTSTSTLNKMCGSGMQTLINAANTLTAGGRDIMVAGGQESMTNAPYLLQKARAGFRLGHGAITDHMFLDGLEDAYDKGKLMGVFAEATAQKYAFSREMQDAFAIESLERAKAAIREGHFTAEITPVTVKSRRGSQDIHEDETPGTAKIEKIPQLKPAFSPTGTVTAANASSISDGAAALLMMRASVAKARGLTPLATLCAHAQHAQAPAWFTTAPVTAITNVLQKAGWHASDVDLFEINEAFAVVTMAANYELDLPTEKVNIYGGACALGHPIGASGARIVVTLLHALQQTGQRKGVAALCIGGGEATALALELI